ncbi:MAG: glycosyltransferase [Gemmatimonadetes bacterium]|nr:glycosyltransferase [Gemmatimonadota bacterium]
MTPELTIVVPYVNGPADLADCLAALAPEAAERPTEVLVVDRVGDAPTVAAGQPWVTVLDGRGQTIPEMRQTAFRAARGPTVAVIEDHVIVPRGWSAALLAARAAGERVIGGAVRNLATDNLVDWAAFLCEYAHLLPPLPAGPVAGLPGNNTGYDRDLLARYAEVLGQGAWEDRLHAAIRADGVGLISHPEIVVGHKMHYTAWLYTSQRYLYSRSYAGKRLAGAPLAKRVIMGLASFALPPVLFARIVSTVWRKGGHRPELVRSLPLLAWFTLAWAAGEVVGCWFGEGDAMRQVR